MNIFWVQVACWNNLLHLGDGCPSTCRNHRVEISGGFPVDEVSDLVRLPCFYEGKIGNDTPLEYEGVTIELFRFLALRNHGSHPVFV